MKKVIKMENIENIDSFELISKCRLEELESAELELSFIKKENAKNFKKYCNTLHDTINVLQDENKLLKQKLLEYKEKEDIHRIKNRLSMQNKRKQLKENLKSLFD